MLTEVKAHLLLGLAHPHRNDEVGNLIQRKATYHREGGHDAESVQMVDERGCFSMNEANLIGEYSRQYHADDTSDSVAWKDIEGVVEIAFRSHMHRDVAHDTCDRSDEDARSYRHETGGGGYRDESNDRADTRSERRWLTAP